MEGQVLLLVLGLEWSCVALTDEALVGGANRLFPPLFNSGRKIIFILKKGEKN